MSDLTHQWLLVTLDVSVKAVLLAGVAAVALRLTRLRDSNLRHRVWTGVLVGMLMLPALAQIVPVLRLPFRIPEAWRIAESEQGGAPATRHAPTPVAAPSVSEEISTRIAHDRSGRPWADADVNGEIGVGLGSFPLPESAFEFDTEIAASAPAIEATDPAVSGVDKSRNEQAVAVSNLPVSSAEPNPLRWPVFLLGLWLVGAGALALRLLVGVVYSFRLLCCSTRITTAELTELGVDSRLLLRGKRPVPMGECPLIRVPLALGVVRPRILLPSEWPNWPAAKLEAVIAHERTHIERSDGAVIFLAELNRCLYWFHPLAWWLRRHLGQLAETACDDAAIDCTGDRATYARHLLEVAATVSDRRSRLIPVGISMARQPNIESRINAILDFARPLSQRLTWVTTLLLLAAMIPLIALAAAVRPATEAAGEQQPEEVAEAPEELESDDVESEPRPTTPPVEDSTITVRGRVLDPNGQPVAARVLVIQSMLSQGTWQAQNRILADFRSSDDGTFSVGFIADDDIFADSGNFLQKAIQVVASADGYGIQWELIDVDNPLTDVTLTLVPDTVPIEGRVLNLEGQPVAGVHVRPQRVESAQGSVDDWIAEARDNPTSLDLDETLSKPVSNPARKIARFPNGPRLELDQIPFVAEAVTDADGRFRLTGLGNDRHVELRLDGPGIASLKLPVVTHTFEPLPMPDLDPRLRLKKCFGANFVGILEPDQPVIGRVFDTDTGQPIERAEIHLRQYGGSRLLVEGFLSTTTDADGRFQLNGIPKPDKQGRPHRLRVELPPDEPYFSSMIDVPRHDALDPVHVEVPLKRGIWITGQVTDAQTGEPLQALVSYYPFLSNENVADFRCFEPGITTLGEGDGRATDGDGRFRIPGIPGRGVVRVVAADSENYHRGVGADSIDGLINEDGRLSLYHMRFPGRSNALTEVNAVDSEQLVEKRIGLEPFQRLTVKLVDPDGQPLTGVRVGNRTVHPISRSYQTYERPTESDEIEVVGLSEEVDRALVLHHQERQLGRIVSISELAESGPPPQTIALQPAATLTGRLVNGDGEAISGHWISPRVDAVSIAQEQWTDGTARYLHVEGRLQSVQTDAEGRFESPLLPGGKYRATLGGVNSREPLLVENLTVGPGERIDLGTIDVTAEPGETKDLGDLRVQPPEDESAASQTNPNETTSSSRASSATSRASDSLPLSYSGHVQTPEGEPIAGAKIWLAVTSYEPEVDGLLQEVGTSDEQGRFHVVLDAATAGRIQRRRPFVRPLLVATAAGRGLDWMPLDVFQDDAAPSEKRDELQGRLDKALGAGRFAGRTLLLRPEERPVRGRVVDLDGRPLRNVKVLVESLRQPDIPLLLKAFEESSRNRVYDALNATGVGEGELARSELQQLFPPVTTDGNGRFEVAGLGQDQLLTLTLAGERVQAQVVHVLGRTMETVRLPHLPSYPHGTKDVYAGYDFSYAVGPSIPVVGVVKDYDTGEPIASTLVYVERLFREGRDENDGQLRLDTRHLRAKTDEQGRFRITGMPPGTGHVLEAIPPKSEPYLMASHEVSLSLDDGDEKQIEIQVKQGIWIEGRVTDLHSGEPLSGRVDYLALNKNPYTLDKLGLKQSWQIGRYPIDSQGRYRVLGLPGPGVVLVNAAGGYPRAFGAESVDGYEAGAGGGYIPTTPVGLPLTNWNFIKQIDPAADAASFICDVQLDAGQSVPGRAIGPDGEPVTGLSVLGEITNNAFWTPHFLDATFRVDGYDGQGPRQLFFKTDDESLVGQYRLEGEAPEDIVVTLEPSVSVTGRLIENETGLPAARYGLYCRKTSLHNEKYPRTTFRIDDCRTDDEGQFEIKGLLPGIVYDINAYNPRRFSNNRNRFQIDLTTANPGDVIELGDVTGPNRGSAQKREESESKKRPSRNRPAPVEGAQESSTKVNVTHEAEVSVSRPVEIRGRVVGTEDKPVVGADVAIIARRIGPARGGDLNPDGVVLAAGTSDENGRYVLTLDGVSGKSHRYAAVVARIDGLAIAFGQLNLDAAETEASLQLQPEEIIRGRLIDIDGHPADGVRLSVTGVMKTVTDDGPPTEGVWYHAGDEAPAAWIPTATTDEQGRFAILGIPVGFGVFLSAAGNDRFAPQGIALNTGMPEQRGERDASYRALVKNVAPGEEAVLALSPAQVFEGVVTYEDTGEPAPHARLTIWASQQEQFGSMVSVAGQADAEGRYRIAPKPGVRFGVNAYPPQGVPYLARRTPHDEAIRWQASDRVKQVDVTLPRGVLVQGRVVEAGTGKPVSRATIQYVPESVNNDHTSDDILTGWQGIQLSNEDGQFEFAILPGPGRLLAHRPDGTHVLQETSARTLSRNRPGGQRRYAHAIARINPEPDAEVVSVTLELQFGATVTGRVVDTSGAPIEEALMVSRLFISPTSLIWRGSSVPAARDGRFQVSGLAEGKEYSVHFLDARNRRGATVLLKGTDDEPTIVLKPCGQARIRFVDDEGQSIPDYSPTLYIVVTPGKLRFDTASFHAGKLAADSDFIQNVDRWNYSTMPKSDENGEVVLPALIPGADYRLVIHREQKFEIASDFQVKSDETFDLGEVVVERSE